jgi:diguanylate cyclase
MRYRDSFERSAECVRLALPLMAKQDTAMHPISFSVWYEHVAGMNAALSTELDRAVATGTALTDAATHELYRKYVASMDEQSAHKVTAGFQRVLSEISESATQVGKQASHFGNALEEWSGHLTTQPGQQSPSGTTEILNDTRKMQSAISVLNQRLDKSQGEIERLQAEVVRAREDALSDGMTGLANRRHFDTALVDCLAEIARQPNGPSLLIADIDHFKKVNDSYGHLFGDKVIRSIAQILKENVRGNDMAARYGGEEFVILLPDTPLLGAHAVAEKIRRTVAGCRILRNDSKEPVAAISISIGVAHYRGSESPTDFVSRADAALYTSKAQGRNRVTVATAG